MNSPDDGLPPVPERRFRFLPGWVLLWAAIACLAVTNLMTARELRRIRQELTARRPLAAFQPLAATEVAKQFQEKTNLGPIAVTVKDVRYSPDGDSYKVSFSWTDATAGRTWSSDIELTSDGYGTYYGEIRNRPFVQPLGYEDAFPVAIRTPSPLGD